MTYKEFGKHMTAQYRKTIMSIKDPRERAKALQPIWDYVDSLDAIEHTGSRGLKSVVSTMQAAKDQFTTLVSLRSRTLSCFVHLMLTPDLGSGLPQYGAN